MQNSFLVFILNPTTSHSNIWPVIYRLKFWPSHFRKNNKLLHFRAKHDGIFERQWLDILKNLLLFRYSQARNLNWCVCILQMLTALSYEYSEISLIEHMVACLLGFYSHISIEILDLEWVLGHVTGFQIENKNAIINPPCWIWVEWKLQTINEAKTIKFSSSKRVVFVVWGYNLKYWVL
jgi:hypothetical protein